MAEIDNKPISPADEIAELKRQMEHMQERLAQLSAASASVQGGDFDEKAPGSGEGQGAAADGPMADAQPAASDEAATDAAEAVATDVADIAAAGANDVVAAGADEGAAPAAGDDACADAADVEKDVVAGGVQVDAAAAADATAAYVTAADDASVFAAPADDACPAGAIPAASDEPAVDRGGAYAQVVVEPVAAPDAAASSGAAQRDSGVDGPQGYPGYDAYVPPSPPTDAAAGAPFASQQGAASFTQPIDAQPADTGAPTPPPSYDAAAAYAHQSAASSARAEYGQPTGQQAYQSGAPYAGGYGSSAQAPYTPYSQTYYQQPVVRTKDHVAAGLLGIFLGTFGIHKFYLGYNTAGLIMLGVSILGGLLSLGLASMVVWLIGLIEGIIYLVKSQGEFEQVYVFGKRGWF